MKTEHPAKLEIDAEQWQRDIRTFAETTNQALYAIVSQLSNSCSNSHTLPQRDPSPPSETTSQSSITASQIGDEDRLAKLKSQLAQRIFKSR